MMNTEEILALTQTLADEEGWQATISQPETNRLDVQLAQPADLTAVVTALHNKGLGYLAAITGLDLGAESNALEALYHFCVGEAVITLRVRLDRDNTAVPTLSQLIPCAEPFEQELREMYGVTVEGLHASDYLYLPDEWPAGVFPMRQDFDVAMLAGRNGRLDE